MYTHALACISIMAVAIQFSLVIQTLREGERRFRATGYWTITWSDPLGMRPNSSS